VDYSVSKLGELSWFQIEIEVVMTEAAVMKASMGVMDHTEVMTFRDPMIKIAIVVEAAIARAAEPASAALPQWMRISNAR
jgi:hypothetical protein